MGWIRDGAYEHEGWVANVLADGRETGSSTNGGVVLFDVTDADREAGHVRQMFYGGEEAVIPWESGLVTTWRVRCECGWTGSERPIQLTTEPSGNVHGHSEGRPETEEAFHQEWIEHVAPFVALHDVGELVEQQRGIEDRIEDAVRLARSNGASWSQIGRAAGLTKQGAQQRWGTGVA